MCPWQRKWEPRAYRVVSRVEQRRGYTGTDTSAVAAAPEFLNFDHSVIPSGLEYVSPVIHARASPPLLFRCLSSFFRNFSPPPSFPILLFSSPGSTIVPPARAHGTLNIRFFETFGFPVSVERSGNARYRLYTCLSTFSLVPPSPSPSPFRIYEWDDTWTKCLRDN